MLVPHFKDEYWLSVGYGLEQEAAAQEVQLRIHEAGGYRALHHQIEQLEACVQQQVSAILIGAVSADNPALLRAINTAAQDVPVFGLVNELHSDQLNGAVGVPWAGMGRAIGDWLSDRHPKGSQAVRAVLISGPPQAGWTKPLESGLRDGLAASSVQIISVYGGDTGLAEQLALVEAALTAHPDIDYLIGTAPAIEAALGLRQNGSPTPKLIATYVSHTVRRGLIGGSVLAVPFDDPLMQGRLAVRQALGKLPQATAADALNPSIRMIDSTTMSADDIALSPLNYFPHIE